jgi:hypothetical protein
VCAGIDTGNIDVFETGVHSDSFDSKNVGYVSCTVSNISNYFKFSNVSFVSIFGLT